MDALTLEIPQVFCGKCSRKVRMTGANGQWAVCDRCNLASDLSAPAEPAEDHHLPYVVPVDPASLVDCEGCQ